jgi:ferritin-like metal-binding protein YciE
MRLNTFENLYADQLNDLYSAETQLVAALPKMAEAASRPELQEAFELHLEQTKQHAEIVKGLLSSAGERAGGEKCKGMEGLLKEGEDVLSKRGEPNIKDAALIGAAQRVEHYEIAGYGTARSMAEQLGLTDHAEQLQMILDQEGETDKILTQLAMSGMSNMGDMSETSQSRTNTSNRSGNRH